ncbi:KpsF/GutQ family sugar-phosphate isomerase [Segetibacter sp. 3557_3]|uniref:KpsF/GutQ family sugar-phosphate isomerase n=1 Tax=Segetibacter sp. 3557_3 TaxID=2547429 RepID=UPI0010588A3D|nr:KpsF/GutQ family sugar-phosphate isomerase [Segetibacter sp. 3557_3]TDH25192.1 KpsF/GutQ family sugar-phosphate isomerase [Segetibacter sp. 3557_3]
MKSSILQTAIRTIELEASSVTGLLANLNDDFEKVVELVHQSSGRLIVSGIGKSAIVAQKIVATLNSTGTAALFMHAADAIHGDLGMIRPDDIVMLMSKSGESAEIKVLVPLVKGFGNLLVGMVGNMNSFLARQSNYVINTTVSKEACPNNLAPTNSTTTQMVMGDTLAVCLMELSGFTGSDFAKIHPGGNLGKRLYLKVQDLFGENTKPKVLEDSTLKEVIVEITRNRLGATAVVDKDDTPIGIITDGDLRRMLERTSSLETITARDILTLNPKTILADELAVSALDLLRKHDISQLIVLDIHGRYAGVLHLHDLVKEGIV